MRYKQRRGSYSQNFFRSPKLVRKLIRYSSIDKNDIVLEIGAGRGIITQELLKIAGKVIAIEVDKKLCLHLKEKFKYAKNLELIQDNFLNFELPTYPYKVFANIPFIITADIIRKLTSDDNFREGYLIVQKEAAKKFIGKPYDHQNQMISALLKPWFVIGIFWKFKRYDFIPRPNVDCVMIVIKRREEPLVPMTNLQFFRDFILHIYNGERGASRLETAQLIRRFEKFAKESEWSQKALIKRKAQKILSEQKLLQKIHRTRKDKHWRKFR